MSFSLPLQFKASDVAKSGEFAGYAAAFGNVDLGGDIVLPGAFSASLAEHKQRGSQPPLLWGHDHAVVLGRLTAIREDRKGLYTEGRLSLATRAADEAYTLLKDGAIGGMSIGYSIDAGGAQQRGDTRLLKQITLHEISLVAVPMNRDARVVSVKAMDCSHPRELEHLLRDTLGFSQRKAKAGANALWPILSGRDGQEPDRQETEFAEIAREFDQISNILKGNSHD